MKIHAATSALFSLFSLNSLHVIRARQRGEILTMVNSSSFLKVTKAEGKKAITITQPIAPHSVVLHVPIKLTSDNFLLRKTQLFPLLNCHDLAHILTQDLPISTQLDDQGGIFVNVVYQTWWHQDQQVLSLIVTSLSESILRCVVGKIVAKEAWSNAVETLFLHQSFSNHAST